MCRIQTHLAPHLKPKETANRKTFYEIRKFGSWYSMVLHGQAENYTLGGYIAQLIL